MRFEELRQDLWYGIRTLGRHPGFTCVSILALALGIAINTIVFTAYKAMVARPIDAHDPDALVNIVLRLQSGRTAANFSYPDFEAYRDGLRSFSGVIAASIEELTLSGTSGVMSSQPDSASLLSRLGLLHSSAVNREIASAFVVSENYFAVLGVAPIRGRAFDGMSAAALVASPSLVRTSGFGGSVPIRTSLARACG